MGKIIAIANQKGGVGKTTTTVNLGASLGILGQKVLLVDFDPQGNLTTGLFGITAKRNLKSDINSVLLKDDVINNAIMKTDFDNLSIIPSTNNALGKSESELAKGEDSPFILRSILEPIKDQYDFILIDCPPSLGFLSINAFIAADTILITVQSEYYALEGTSQLVKTIKQARQLTKTKFGYEGITIEGVLITMNEVRTLLGAEVAGIVRKQFRGEVYDTTIPRNISLAEAPRYQKPAIYFNSRSKGALAYMSLAEEVLKQNGK